MNRISVASDVMSSVGYDSAAAVLEIEFRNGSVYEYLEVPSGHYDALLDAASKGRFFNACVRPAFRFRRIV